MNIPSSHDLLALLDRLESATADDLETQWLDFKPWQGAKEDMKVAVEYAACFANAEGGAVVFGVADRTRGRAKAIHGASGYDLDTSCSSAGRRRCGSSAPSIRCTTCIR